MRTVDANVALILATRARTPVTIDRNATLLQAAELMTKRKIGSVLIVGPNERLDGILTERDFMRKVAEFGAAALSSPVHRHMTTEVISCTPATLIDDAEFEMNSRKFRHMPVKEGARIIGVISAGDITAWRLVVATRKQARSA